jgi:GGDEF domain-containing protein
VNGCGARAGIGSPWRRRAGHPIELLFVDLDDFKRVNDGLGHDAGDELLVAVAHRLQACVRPEDTVARLGGDEFAILLDRAETPEVAAAAARRVLDGLRTPFTPARRAIGTGPVSGPATSSVPPRTTMSMQPSGRTRPGPLGPGTVSSQTRRTQGASAGGGAHSR